MEHIATAFATVMGSLGAPAFVALMMTILGVCFRAGFSTSLRGGLYTGIGLAGLSIILNAVTNALSPAILAFSANFAANLTVTDVGWGSMGIAFSWPGMAFVILGTLLVNAVMIWLKLTKTMWTDVWNMWHGNTLGGMVWAMTGGNIWLGVAAGILFLTIGAVIGDLTAKDYQEFNDMPGIAIPCTTATLGLFAKPFNALLDRIPVVNRIRLEPEIIQNKAGIFGDLGVMGAMIGVGIGVLGRLDYGAVLQLGVSVGVLMIFLPKAVSVMCEGVLPITDAIVAFVREKLNGREIYVAVNGAVLMRHPSVMASTVILYPLIVLLSLVLPGNTMLTVASLSIVPYWCGTIAAQFRGNVFRMVLFVLVWCVPVLLLASAQSPINTLVMGKLGLADPGIANSCLDMAGDPLGAGLIALFRLAVPAA